MAEQSNTVTIKLTKGRAFDNIIGEQELKSQREALSGKGFNVIPIRDRQGNILGFEDEFQQGIDLKTPTALSPKQRRAQESEGFQEGFAPGQEEEDFGRPDLSKTIEASSKLNQQIKEAESRLLRIQGKTSADFARLAKRTNMTLGDALKLGEAETKRQQELIDTLKDKKTTLDEVAFGKKPTPSEALAERRFEETRKRTTRIKETIDPETGKVVGGVSVPVETEGTRERELQFKKDNLAFKEKKLKKDLEQLGKGKAPDKLKLGDKVIKLKRDESELLGLIDSGELDDKELDRASFILGLIKRQMNLALNLIKKQTTPAEPEQKNNTSRLNELFPETK